MTRALASADAYGYLQPLFDRAAGFRSDGAFHPLPGPEPGSSIAAEDAALAGWGAATLIQSSLTAGVAHVDALARLVLVARAVDSFSPWTLLRGAIENISTAVWLLTGESRLIRRTRALSLWAQDMHLRNQHEQDTGHVPTGPNGRSGSQREQEILKHVHSLGLVRLSRDKMAASAIIEEAAVAVGLDPVAVRASWRVGSGFAHGRYWPNLRALQPRDAHPAAEGHLVALVLDKAKHKQLSDACLAMLNFADERYEARRRP